MGLLIGPDNNGDIQFRMVEPGYDPISPPSERIVFDGRYAACRIIADPAIPLDGSSTGGESTTYTFPEGDLGFVPYCKPFIYRPGAGLTYRAPRVPQYGGGEIYTSGPGQVVGEGVYISQVYDEVERSFVATVYTDRVVIKNFMRGSNYWAKIYLFVV